jgi:hypothetical protein
MLYNRGSLRKKADLAPSSLREGTANRAAGIREVRTKALKDLVSEHPRSAQHQNTHD